ncbi:hypothetical protein BT69DRAFT_1065634 [Atractiella rhizophila]|nr:hypothetical protein BT69DRAFT_1065634 [Atractiella rhizophila]
MPLRPLSLVLPDWRGTRSGAPIQVSENRRDDDNQRKGGLIEATSLALDIFVFALSLLLDSLLLNRFFGSVFVISFCLLRAPLVSCPVWIGLFRTVFNVLLPHLFLVTSPAYPQCKYGVISK